MKENKSVEQQLKEANATIEALKKALEWAKSEIVNSGEIRFDVDDTFSHENCDYILEPIKGVCDFCCGYVDMVNALKLAKERSR